MTKEKMMFLIKKHEKEIVSLQKEIKQLIKEKHESAILKSVTGNMLKSATSNMLKSATSNMHYGVY